MDPKFLQSFLQANNFYIQGHLEEAISLYTELLAISNNYDVLINRCVARIKQCDYEHAIEDSEKAIIEDPSRYEAYFNRGIANFYNGKFEVALKDFFEAKTKKIPEKIVEIWLSKCNLEIKLQSSFNQPKQEKPIVPQQPQQEPLQQENTNENASKEKNGENNEKTEEKEEKEPHYDLIKEKVFSAAGVLSYTWYQTDIHIGLEFDQKIENKDVITHHFEARKININFPIVGNKKPFHLELLLWDEILPETAKIILTLSKLEIKIEKKNKQKNWLRLESEEKPKKIAVQEIEKPPSYPTSSIYKKDWSKLDRELEEELSKDKDEDALNGLFRQIYQNSDENTRRAMIKSFQTSNGTVL